MGHIVQKVMQGTTKKEGQYTRAFNLHQNTEIVLEIPLKVGHSLTQL